MVAERLLHRHDLGRPGDGPVVRLLRLSRHWHHVVLTYQSGVENGATLYVDGAPEVTTTITVANQSNDALIGSGSTSGVEYFDGNIDDVTLYPSTLTAAQVTQLYESA